MFRKYHSVLQRDEKDCGPACILTIAKQYNTNFSVAKLRDISGTDINGTNIIGMIKGLDYIGFDAKAVKVEDEKLDNSIVLPAIAHIKPKNNFYHYIVIHDINKKNIIVSDPAIGIKKYSDKEFLEIWTGILILVDKKKNFEKRGKNEYSLMRFFHIIKNQKNILFNVFIVSILTTFLGLLGSFSSKFLVDYILKDRLINTLNLLVIGLVILEIIKMLLGIFREYLLIYLGQKMDISIY